MIIYRIKRFSKKRKYKNDPEDNKSLEEAGNELIDLGDDNLKAKEYASILRTQRHTNPEKNINPSITIIGLHNKN